MKQTWKPVTGGILSIVAGALDITFGLLLLLAGGALSGILTANGAPPLISFLPLPVLGVVATLLFVIGAVAIAGGSCAIRRKAWPLALAGGICALFPPQLMLLGVMSIVFVVLGKDEFE